MNKPIEGLLLQITNVIGSPMLGEPYEYASINFLKIGKIIWTNFFGQIIRIKKPSDMAKPKSFDRAMWIFFCINKLMMTSMCTHPIDWITLNK